MKIIKIKTVYNGMVAFPEKFYRPNAVVRVGDMFMDLKGLKPTGYSKWLDDKFGREKYRLMYFNWNPRKGLLPLKGKAKKQAEAFEKYNAMSEEERFYKYH